MTAIHRSALLPFSDQQLYALVNDVEAYPQYMDGCVGSQVLRSEAHEMEARLDLARGGIKQSFTTLNQLKPHECIHLTLVDGPFDRFDGVWRFEALAEQACKITLDLEFTVKSSLLSVAAAHLFDRVAGSLVDAVVARAQTVYAA